MSSNPDEDFIAADTYARMRYNDERPKEFDESEIIQERVLSYLQTAREVNDQMVFDHLKSGGRWLVIGIDEHQYRILMNRLKIKPKNFIRVANLYRMVGYDRQTTKVLVLQGVYTSVHRIGLQILTNSALKYGYEIVKGYA